MACATPKELAALGMLELESVRRSLQPSTSTQTERRKVNRCLFCKGAYSCSAPKIQPFVPRIPLVPGKSDNRNFNFTWRACAVLQANERRFFERTADGPGSFLAVTIRFVGHLEGGVPGS